MWQCLYKIQKDPIWASGAVYLLLSLLGHMQLLIVIIISNWPLWQKWKTTGTASNDVDTVGPRISGLYLDLLALEYTFVMCIQIAIMCAWWIGGIFFRNISWLE